MKGGRFLIKALALLAVASSLASAYDPSLLQDFCVAIQEPNGVFVNGKDCKDPKLVTAKDFYFQGLYKPGNTAANKLGFAVTPVLVDQLPGLNTLGVSLARLDLAVGGLNPPIGQIHFEFNIGKVNAAAFATFSSQNPGVTSIANAVFGSNPPISLDVLTKAFQVNEDVIKCLQKPFRPMT